MIHNGTLPSKRFSMTEQYVIGLEFAGQKLLGSRTICEWTSPIHTSNQAEVCSTFLHEGRRGRRTNRRVLDEILRGNTLNVTGCAAMDKRCGNSVRSRICFEAQHVRPEERWLSSSRSVWIGAGV